MRCHAPANSRPTKYPSTVSGRPEDAAERGEAISSRPAGQQPQPGDMQVAGMAQPEAEHAPVASGQQPQARDAEAADRAGPQAERVPAAQAAAPACRDKAKVLVDLGLQSQSGEYPQFQANAPPLAELFLQETPQQPAAAAAETEEAKSAAALVVKEEGSMRDSPAWKMRPARGEEQHTDTTLFAEICKPGDSLALHSKLTLAFSIGTFTEAPFFAVPPCRCSFQLAVRLLQLWRSPEASHVQTPNCGSHHVSPCVSSIYLNRAGFGRPGWRG